MTFDAAYETYWPQTVRICRRILGVREEAEDAAADAWGKIWRNWGNVSDPAPYIARAARRTAIDRYRRDLLIKWWSLDFESGRNTPRVGYGDHNGVGTETGDRPRGSAATHLSIVAPVNWSSQAGDLLDMIAALARIPAQQRAALLAWVAGYSHEDIAVQMRATVGTVRTWIVRARKRLRLILAGLPIPAVQRPRLPPSSATTGRYTDRRREQSRQSQQRAKARREGAA